MPREKPKNSPLTFPTHHHGHCSPRRDYDSSCSSITVPSSTLSFGDSRRTSVSSFVADTTHSSSLSLSQASQGPPRSLGGRGPPPLRGWPGRPRPLPDPLPGRVRRHRQRLPLPDSGPGGGRAMFVRDEGKDGSRRRRGDRTPKVRIMDPPLDEGGGQGSASG
ncbi:hypothetical protein Acr_29g0000740 [Actinidia rufa]|uniref:Uncharacterized protein n=1 Tax=Actinidia rufa TaxID=165716 RepID=A0A7J0HD29_9ERIC|nr:hypothetical protein Acr_29g0000740 [Actinidia rufa]